MKKHTKFVAYALAGFMAVSTINIPSVYAEEIPTETVVDTTNNSATYTSLLNIYIYFYLYPSLHHYP